MKTKDNIMKLIIILNALLITVIASGQHFRYEQDKQYSYFSIGSSAATTPHTNDLVLNGIATAGVRYELIDISINYEYVNIQPNYHSYFAQLQVMPLDIHNFEFGIGGRYGRIIRPTKGTFNYFGVNGEIRFTPWKKSKIYLSLMGSYDYRGDIRIMWGDDYWKFSSHFKIGIKV